MHRLTKKSTVQLPACAATSDSHRTRARNRQPWCRQRSARGISRRRQAEPRSAPDLHDFVGLPRSDAIARRRHVAHDWVRPYAHRCLSPGKLRISHAAGSALVEDRRAHRQPWPWTQPPRASSSRGKKACRGSREILRDAPKIFGGPVAGSSEGRTGSTNIREMYDIVHSM